jgi:hypothetical protein
MSGTRGSAFNNNNNNNGVASRPPPKKKPSFLRGGKLLAGLLALGGGGAGVKRFLNAREFKGVVPFNAPPRANAPNNRTTGVLRAYLPKAMNKTVNRVSVGAPNFSTYRLAHGNVPLFAPVPNVPNKRVTREEALKNLRRRNLVRRMNEESARRLLLNYEAIKHPNREVYKKFRNNTPSLYSRIVQGARSTYTKYHRPSLFNNARQNAQTHEREHLEEMAKKLSTNEQENIARVVNLSSVLKNLPLNSSKFNGANTNRLLSSALAVNNKNKIEFITTAVMPLFEKINTVEYIDTLKGSTGKLIGRLEEALDKFGVLQKRRQRNMNNAITKSIHTSLENVLRGKMTNEMFHLTKEDLRVLNIIANKDMGVINTIRYMSRGLLIPNKGGNVLIVPVVYQQLSVICNVLSAGKVPLDFLGSVYRVTGIKRGLEYLSAKLARLSWSMMVQLAKTRYFKIGMAIITGISGIRIGLRIRRGQTTIIATLSEISSACMSVIKAPYKALRLSAKPFVAGVKLSMYAILFSSLYVLFTVPKFAVDTFVSYILESAKSLKPL